MAENSPHRLGLTLDPDEYAQMVAYARQAGRPVATVAKRILLAAIAGHDPDAAAAALSRERDRVRDLEAELTRLQTAGELGAKLPHWRWPLNALLADRPWWREWLPLLNELIGRRLQHDRRSSGEGQPPPVLDDRGFGDLMRYLFPDLVDDEGSPVPWHSPEYRRYARLAWDHTSPRPPSAQRPVRAEVWEPVVRHVARALSALETTSQAPGDAYTHLRVQAEIRGEWMRTLGAMLGEGSAQRPEQLPRDLLP
jgi:hypothetical protein